MGGKIPRGFTIIETLIVLSVTGILLVSALLLVSGRQGDTEFSVGVRQVVNQLKSDVDIVQNGNFSLPNNMYCREDSSTNFVKIDKQPSTNGANFGCQIIGIGLQIRSTGYSIYPVASNQYNYINPAVSQQITSLNQINPCATYKAESHNCNTYPAGGSGTVKNVTLPYGIKFINTTQSPYNLFAYYNLSTTASLKDCGGNNILGSSSGSALNVDMFTINPVSINAQSENISDYIDGPLDSHGNILAGGICQQFSDQSITQYLRSVNSTVDLCLQSGTNGKYAVIELGNGGPTAVTFKYILDTVCP